MPKRPYSSGDAGHDAKETGSPGQGDSQRRKLDVTASTLQHNAEIAAMSGPRQEITATTAQQRITEKLKPIAKALGAMTIGFQNIRKEKGNTHYEEQKYGSIVNKCDILIDYIESGEKGTARKTNEDPGTAAAQLIEFLRARGQTRTKETEGLHSLADAIERNKHLFIQRTQQEVAQPPSSPHDTEPEHTFNKKVLDLNEHQLIALSKIVRNIYDKAHSATLSPSAKSYYHKIVRCLDQALRSKDIDIFSPETLWAEETTPPSNPDQALSQAITLMRTELRGMFYTTRQQLKNYANEIEGWMKK